MNEKSTKLKIQGEVKEVGIFLAVLAAFQIIMAYLVTPVLFFQAAVIAVLAYFAYVKESKKAAYIATGIYLVDTLISLPLLLLSPGSLFIKVIILYYLLEGCWSIFKANKKNELNHDLQGSN